MKRERLDQILVRLGYVTESDIRQALVRRKGNATRIGSQLVHLQVLTEDQLAQALSIQYDVPGFRAEEHEINDEAVNKLPYEIAFNHQVLPIQFDRRNRIVSLAVVNPGDKEMYRQVKRIFRVEQMDVYVAPESVLMTLIARHYLGHKSSGGRAHFELPYYFSRRGRTQLSTSQPSAAAPRRVLVVHESPSIRDSLGPVFAEEGVSLDVAGDAETAARLLRENNFDHILVSGSSMDSFSTWWREGKLPPLNAEVSAFSSVSGALLDSPVPYRRVYHSLLRALQRHAEFRCANTPWVPPYAVICNDLRRLAQAMGCRHLAMDGLQIAACLLVPGEQGDATIDSNGVIEDHLHFVDFTRSLDDANWLHFPWDIYRMLQLFGDLSGGKQPTGESRARHPELVLAAQILAAVWYYRVGLRQSHESCDDPTTLYSRLRAVAGRIAREPVVGTYIKLLEGDHEEHRPEDRDTILILSRNDNVARQFSARLSRAGFDAHILDDLAKAKRRSEYRPPVAILVEHESFGTQTAELASLFQRSTRILLYAFTRRTEPSVTLNLLDAGFDDVFSPPYQFDAITSRIVRSLRGHAHDGRRGRRPGTFGATFEAFAFIDLLQALGQSLKTVHVHVTRTSTGDSADIYFKQGQIMHARCGRRTGVEVVFNIIQWGSDGTFFVEPVDRIPERNVFDANEAILMEGCRLLDERVL